MIAWTFVAVVVVSAALVRGAYHRGVREGLRQRAGQVATARAEVDHANTFWRDDATHRVARFQRRFRAVLAEARAWKSEAQWSDRRATRAEAALRWNADEVRRLREALLSDDGTGAND